MTAAHVVDPAGLRGDALAQASPDLMRHLLQEVVNTLLSADADAVMGAEYGRASPTRTAHRTGHRHRDLDTRVGTIDVALPKLRSGTYFPDGCCNASAGRVHADHGRHGRLSRRCLDQTHGPAREDPGDRLPERVAGPE